MTPENARHAISQEWALSQEAWAEAEVLKSADLWRGALTRYYYAAFHAARAALLSRGVEPTTHSGARTELARNFVRTGIIPREVSRALASLQKEREDADYTRALSIDAGAVDEAREAALSVMATLETVLRAEGWL